MKRLCVVICIVLSGCATGKEGSGILSQAPDKELARAMRLSDEGNEKEAAAALKEIVASKRVAGVSDEALFRLSLIQLKSGVDRENLEQSLKRLETLQREYPSSQWTHLAVPIVTLIRETLHQTRELRLMARENKEAQSLKNQSLSLLKENKELRQTIEKLKHLDLELEHKTRRR